MPAVPSGASTGEREALELRDGDPLRYRGKGVTNAVTHVNDEIAEALAGRDATNQATIDRKLVDLDSTPNNMRVDDFALAGQTQRYLNITDEELRKAMTGVWERQPRRRARRGRRVAEDWLVSHTPKASGAPGSGLGIRDRTSERGALPRLLCQNAKTSTRSGFVATR